MINVVPPYERHEVLVVGDAGALKNSGVKYCVVKLEYDFFGKPRSKQVLVRVKDGQVVEEKVELVQPKGEYQYEYEIKWGLNDGREVSKPHASDTSGIIFVDELPK